jgi:hypothetical protein
MLKTKPDKTCRVCPWLVKLDRRHLNLLSKFQTARLVWSASLCSHPNVAICANAFCYRPPRLGQEAGRPASMILALKEYTGAWKQVEWSWPRSSRCTQARCTTTANIFGGALLMNYNTNKNYKLCDTLLSSFRHKIISLQEVRIVCFNAVPLRKILNFRIQFNTQSFSENFN